MNKNVDVGYYVDEFGRWMFFLALVCAIVLFFCWPLLAAATVKEGLVMTFIWIGYWAFWLWATPKPLFGGFQMHY